MPLLSRFFKPNIDKLKARADIAGLLAALSFKNDAGIRCRAAVALGDSSDPRVAPALAAATRSDRESAVRVSALRALSPKLTSSDPGVIPALMGALSDFDSSVRMEALRALKHRGVSQDVALLTQALMNRDLRSEVREALADILGQINDETAARALKDYQLEQQQMRAARQVSEVLGEYSAFAGYVRRSKSPEAALQRVGFFDAKDPSFKPASDNLFGLHFMVSDNHSLRMGVRATEIAHERPDTLADKRGDIFGIGAANLQYYMTIMQDLLLIQEVNEFIVRTTIAPLMAKLDGGPMSQNVFTEVSINAVERLVNEKLGALRSVKDLKDRIIAVIAAA